MPRLAMCTGCGRRPTVDPSKRCTRCRLPSRPRGNAFEPTRRAVYLKDRGICHLCGEPVAPGQRWHVDRKHPRSKHGADAMSNYGLAHDHCNLRKGART